MLKVVRLRTLYTTGTVALLIVVCISELQQYTNILHHDGYYILDFTRRNSSNLSDGIELRQNKSSNQDKVYNMKYFTNFAERKVQSGKNTVSNQTQRRTFVKAQNVNIYLFSAIGVYYSKVTHGSKVFQQYQSSEGDILYNTIVLNGWEDKMINNTHFTCCFQLSNDMLVSSISNNKRDWAYLGMAKFQAKQYVCPFNFRHSLIEYISVTHVNSTCSFNVTSYIKPFFPPNDRSKGIAVCTKLAFGSLSPGRILEWMEVHRYFGVKKVLVYPINLNAKAMEILKYYELLGFVQLIEFGLPEKERCRREAGGKNMQSWNDEQVVVFDCQERLSTFKYVAVVDTDEYVITANNMTQNEWVKFLDAIWNRSNIAGLRFPTKIHMIDWGPTTNKSSLFIGQYLNSSGAVMDRPKNIYMPSRVIPGSVSTHALYGLPGYYLKNVYAHNASIHHFRNSRAEWRTGKTYLHTLLNRPYLRKYESNDLLIDFQRYKSQEIENIAKQMEHNVSSLKQLFHIDLQ